MAGAAGAGLRAVRVLTGEYVGVPDAVAPWRTVDRIAEVPGVLTPLFPSPTGSRSPR